MILKEKSLYEVDNDNYYIIEDYKKCYIDPLGYYLDKIELKYKKCFLHAKNVKEMVII